ncbi:MAG: gliding motility-associated C-terminal domain-containing protein [Agriterribacter sp.]
MPLRKILNKKLFFINLILCPFICQAQNLIQNHSCDSPLVNGKIPYWEEVNGLKWGKRFTDPLPFAGDAYFFAGAVSNARLKQEIDISGFKCLIDLGVQYFEFIGYVRAYEQSPSDASNIEIQFFTQSNTLLSSFNFGPYNQTITWKKIDSVLHVPVNSRKVVVMLNSIRYNGSNNDGYYDELSLIPLPVDNNINKIHIDTSICEGQNYLGYSSSGIFIDTLISSNGCDSIRTLNLTVKHKSSSTVNQIICEGESYLGYSTSGSFINTFVSNNGCDSIMTLNLIVKPRSYSTINEEICEGQSFLGYSSGGAFTDTLIATNGCDSIRTLILSVNKKPVPDLGFDKELCAGDSLVLLPGVFNSYLWQDNSTLNHFVVKQPGLYSVEVSNICGSVSDEIIVAEKLCNEIFPNAFSPNNDKKNDFFKILRPFNLVEYKLRIYNRWGQKMFDTSNPEEGWDGSYNGIPQNAGIYVYYCEYKKNGVYKQIRNNLILMR